jgi:Serine dehydratase alpha chain
MNRHTQLMRIWSVMDDCIRTGVSTSETVLPGRLQLRRKAPLLYKRLMRGYIFATTSYAFSISEATLFFTPKTVPQYSIPGFPSHRLGVAAGGRSRSS